MKKHSVIVTVLALSTLAVGYQSPSSAIQIGPEIKWTNHGPSIGGYKPGERPFPDRPLDGFKIAVRDTGKILGDAGTTVWKVVTRPFVEAWKFLRDPLVGLRRYAHDFYERAVVDLNALAYSVIKWLSLGFGISVAFATVVAMAFAWLLMNRKQTKARPRRKHRRSIAA